MLKEISVDLFIREAASSSPIPNGSSIAALAGAQAAALLSMYCNLSMDREKFGDIVDLMSRLTIKLQLPNTARKQPTFYRKRRGSMA